MTASLTARSIPGSTRSARQAGTCCCRTTIRSCRPCVPFRARTAWLHPRRVRLASAASGPVRRNGALCRRRAAVPEAQFAWRIRVRLAWAAAYDRARTRLLPQAAVRRALLAGPRPATAGRHGADAERPARRLDRRDAGTVEGAGLSSAHVNSSAQGTQRHCAAPAGSSASTGSSTGAIQGRGRIRRLSWRTQPQEAEEHPPGARAGCRAGVACEIRHGDELDPGDWRTIHRLYLNDVRRARQLPGADPGVLPPSRCSDAAPGCRRARAGAGRRLLPIALLLRSRRPRSTAATGAATRQFRGCTSRRATTRASTTACANGLTDVRARRAGRAQARARIPADAHALVPLPCRPAFPRRRERCAGAGSGRARGNTDPN